MNNKTVGEPVYIISLEVFLHIAKALPTTRIAGGFICLSKFRFSVEKLLNDKQGKCPNKKKHMFIEHMLDKEKRAYLSNDFRGD